MRGKIGIIMFAIILFSLILTLILGPKYQEAQQEMILSDSDTITPSIADENEIEEENVSIEYEGLYQKLDNGQQIEMLIVGDSVGQGEGALESSNKWFNLLSNSILEQFESNTDINTITRPEADVFTGLVDYSLSASSNNDLVIVMLGHSDTSDIGDGKEFSDLYENLLRQIMEYNPKAEVMTVVENSLSDAKANMIKEIANHYHTTYVDTRQAFEQSGVPLDELTVDGNLPNDEGNKLYSELMFDHLLSNMYRNKVNDHQLGEPLYAETEKFDELNVINFMGVVDKPVSFDFTGSMIGLTFNTGENNGIADIYLDGEYVRSFDTYVQGEDVVKKILISSDLEEGEHVITVQPSLLYNEASSGSGIELLEFIVN